MSEERAFERINYVALIGIQLLSTEVMLCLPQKFAFPH